MQWIGQQRLSDQLDRRFRLVERRPFEGLKAKGYVSSYDRVTAFVRQWHREAGHVTFDRVGCILGLFDQPITGRVQACRAADTAGPIVDDVAKGVRDLDQAARRS